MDRCEGYYKLENRRCDRAGTQPVRASDGERYLVCDYHRRQSWTASVARWHGQSGIRRSVATDLRAPEPPQALVFG
jgi:hypothetical protein